MSLTRALTIGFAGQRPLALQRAGVQGERLAAEVRRVLGGFAAGGRPARLITGLAMGADQMAVRAVTGLKAAGQDWQVQGVLPCPAALFIAHALSDYAAEHGSPIVPAALVAHWRGLLTQLDSLQTLPTLWRAGAPPLLPPWALPTLTEAFGHCDPPPPDMTLDYAPASNTILTKSDLLLAVWDGSPSGGPGGTADMIVTARAIKMPVVIIDPKTGQADLQVSDVLLGLD